MKALFSAVLSVALGLGRLLADPASDLQTVQGHWQPSQAEIAGKPMPDAFVKSVRMSLKNGKYEVMVGDKPDRGTYTLDASSKPRQMIIVGTDGPNVGKTFPAIYEITGDTLRICYDLSGMKAPTEFKTLPGTRLYLVTYRRSND